MRLSLRQTDMSGAREFQQKEWRGSDVARVQRQHAIERIRQ
ncbi:MAG: hypothetical protein OJF50_003397 [Nitrospira sp.]|nr:hypothetical protein [Nitrospira sp.]